MKILAMFNEHLPDAEIGMNCSDYPCGKTEMKIREGLH